MQSEHSCFLPWLLDIWSDFSNQDKTTFLLVLITLQSRSPIFITFVQRFRMFTNRPSASNKFDSFSQCCHQDFVKSRQEKQLFASLRVQTPVLHLQNSRQELCKVKLTDCGENGWSNQQPHIYRHLVLCTKMATV